MISAVILAAGMSRRMGRPKMLLPWEATTVLGRILQVIKAAELESVMVVTGASRGEVEAICTHAGVQHVLNPDYSSGEMLSSLQVGLRALPAEPRAALVVLGDQPAIELQVVSRLINAYAETGDSLIVPSYRHRRGHPWLVGRELWPRLCEMQPPETPRDFLHRRSGIIHHVEVDTASIFQDIDTPDDYLKSRP
jgi:molybdenum cofactor cytidylyltransferase